LDDVLPQLRSYDVLLMTFTLWELGRPLDRIARTAAQHPTRPWHQVAAAIARGDLVAAANRLADFGARTFEAYVRLRAAEKLAVEGEAAAADVQLERALGFYRSVGANYYIRQGEELRATTASYRTSTR